MQCPECKVEAFIAASRTEVVGDDSPDKTTEVYTVLEMQCRNPNCPRHGQSVGEIRHRVFPPLEEPEETS